MSGTDLARVEVSALPERRLEELAGNIREGHESLHKQMERAVQSAIDIGRDLLEARELVAYGGFNQWIEDECKLVAATGYYYMRLAYYADVLPVGVTQKEAHQFLRGLPGIDGRKAASYPDSVKKEAIRRRKEGESFEGISRALGPSSGTISMWCGQKKRGLDVRKRLANRRYREKMERREAARLEGQKRAVARGGNLAKAYSTLRTLAQQVDAARDEADDAESRRELSAALTRVYASELHILKALGLDYGNDVFRQRRGRGGHKN